MGYIVHCKDDKLGHFIRNLAESIGQAASWLPMLYTGSL